MINPLIALQPMAPAQKGFQVLHCLQHRKQLSRQPHFLDHAVFDRTSVGDPHVPPHRHGFIRIFHIHPDRSNQGVFFQQRIRIDGSDQRVMGEIDAGVQGIGFAARFPYQ